MNSEKTAKETLYKSDNGNQSVNVRQVRIKGIHNLKLKSNNESIYGQSINTHPTKRVETDKHESMAKDLFDPYGVQNPVATDRVIKIKKNAIRYNTHNSDNLDAPALNLKFKSNKAQTSQNETDTARVQNQIDNIDDYNSSQSETANQNINDIGFDEEQIQSNNNPTEIRYKSHRITKPLSSDSSKRAASETQEAKNSHHINDNSKLPDAIQTKILNGQALTDGEGQIFRAWAEEHDASIAQEFNCSYNKLMQEEILNRRSNKLQIRLGSDSYNSTKHADISENIDRESYNETQIHRPIQSHKANRLFSITRNASQIATNEATQAQEDKVKYRKIKILPKKLSPLEQSIDLYSKNLDLSKKAHIKNLGDLRPSIERVKMKKHGYNIKKVAAGDNLLDFNVLSRAIKEPLSSNNSNNGQAGSYLPQTNTSKMRRSINVQKGLDDFKIDFQVHNNGQIFYGKPYQSGVRQYTTSALKRNGNLINPHFLQQRQYNRQVIQQNFIGNLDSLNPEDLSLSAKFTRPYIKSSLGFSK